MRNSLNYRLYLNIDIDYVTHELFIVTGGFAGRDAVTFAVLEKEEHNVDTHMFQISKTVITQYSVHFGINFRLSLSPEIKSPF